MKETEKVEFEIHIRAPDATDEELDRLTRQLLAEIKETDIDSAELGKSTIIPNGAKGDPITIGTILLASLPAAMPKVIDMVKPGPCAEAIALSSSKAKGSNSKARRRNCINFWQSWRG